MTGLEITLVIIGVIFLLGSFFVQDRLSGADMKQIANISEKEISMIIEKQMKKAEAEIEDKVDLAVEETYDATRRAINKETNEKLSSISEFSDTVIESVNKSHNEIMFLYSMLNDKHKELTDLASELSEFSNSIRQSENDMLQRISFASEMGNSAVPPQLSAVNESMMPKTTELEKKAQTPKKKPSTRTAKTETASADEKPTASKAAVKTGRRSASRKKQVPEVVSPVAAGDLAKANEEILRMHMDGVSEVDIARTLGRGLGEVRFVIGLYRGDVVK